MGNKILIVDDTKNIRTMLETCLKVEGYEVETCSSGKDGIEKIKSDFFDYAFVDIRMPEISGTEVLKSISGMPIKTKVIIMTAYATVKNAVECTQLGAAAYLQKPFSASKVVGVLNDLENGVIQSQSGKDTKSGIENHVNEESIFQQTEQDIKQQPAEGKSSLTDAPRNRESVLEYIDYSRELVAKHDYEMAYKVLKKCLSIDPTNYLVYRTLAEVFHAKGNSEMENKFLAASRIFK